jgi:hypothetical protein
LDQKTQYFFSFFRIFRFEHAAITNFFIENHWINLDSIEKLIYNMNLYPVGEIEYHSFHINNSLKIYGLFCYFVLMPAILTLDFIITQCSSVNKFKWFHENIALQYFFSGPLFMFIAFSYPIGVTAFLELKSMTIANNYQMYSFMVSCLVTMLYSLVWLSCWLVVLMHYKYRNHPLLRERYAFVYKAVKSERVIH